MRRILKVIGLLVAGLVALVATVYVVHGLSGMRQVAVAKEHAVAELDEALATARPDAVAEHHRAAATLGPPTYDWQEVVCELSTNDAGWIVNDYVQECSLRVVTLLESRDASTGCKRLAVPESSGQSTIVAIWRAPASALESEEYESGCPSGLLTPGFRSASRLLDGTRPRDLDESPSWIVVESRTSLTDSVLGCSPWGVVFCSAPVDEPVLGVSDDSAGSPD